MRTACPQARRPFLLDAGCPAPPATYPDGRVWTSTQRPFALARKSNLSPSLFGLAPGGVCRAAGVAAGAVRSYRTVSPLPRLTQRPRRSVLCGTVPELAPAGCYPAPLVHGARTFLSDTPAGPSCEGRKGAPERPSSQLTKQAMGTLGGAVKRPAVRSRAPAPKWSSPDRAWQANPARWRASMHRRRHRPVPGGNGAGRLPPRRA